LLTPEVQKRVLEFNKACIEELFREAHRIVELYEQCRGVPEAKECNGKKYWSGVFETAYQDCLRRIKEGTVAYKNDGMLSYHSDKDCQPRAGYQVFWQWEARRRQYPFERVRPTRRLKEYYVPPS
jgi:hypothetical protein